MATQASPGLNAPCAYDPVPGIPSNMSNLAAISAGLMPANIQPSNPGISRPPVSLLAGMSAAGAQGTKNAVTGGINIANNSVNGGSGPGAGNANCELGNSSGQSNMIAGSIPASSLLVNPPNGYQG